MAYLHMADCILSLWYVVLGSLTVPSRAVAIHKWFTADYDMTSPCALFPVYTPTSAWLRRSLH